MSDTPRTDAAAERFGYAIATDPGCTCAVCTFRNLAAQLERELSATSLPGVRTAEPFECCGAADPPCASFEESCQNPANYKAPKCAACHGQGWVPHCCGNLVYGNCFDQPPECCGQNEERDCEACAGTGRVNFTRTDSLTSQCNSEPKA